MARHALIETWPRGMRVVALRAGVERLHVPKARVIHSPSILIATVGAPREQRAGRGIVVNVEEAEGTADLVVAAHGRVVDGLLHGEARRSALMAGHAARLAAQSREL